MGGAELQMSRIKAGVTRHKVYNDYDFLVDYVHFSEGGKIQISPKLNFYYKIQSQIRNQRLRIRRNTLFSGRKAGVFRCAQLFLVIFSLLKLVMNP